MAGERFLIGAGEVTNENFSGFVCIAAATITEIGYGHGKFTDASPNTMVFPSETTVSVAVTAGTYVPMNFSHIKISGGTLALLQGTK